jgi:hypothetical protein
VERLRYAFREVIAMVKLVIPVETFIVNHLFEDAEFFLEQAKELREKDAHVARRYIRAFQTQHETTNLPPVPSCNPVG